MRSPLVWLSLLAGAGAVLCAARWLRTGGRDPLGRRLPFPTISVVLLLVVAAAAGWGPLRTWRLERALSAAGTQVAGIPMTVRCQGLGGALLDTSRAAGHVRGRPDGTMETVAHVDWDMCRRLRSYIGKGGVAPTAEEVVAVHLVSHEARHVAGTSSEAVAECEAVQRDALTARALGASAEDARRLALSYWRSHYPRMPSAYVSPECTPGGLLDEGLPAAPWVSPG